MLEQRKANLVSRDISVMVLTSSAEDADIAAAYCLGTNSCMVKPVDFAKFLEAARKILFYSCVTNQPPR